jgi:hypothetical protein
MRKRDSFFRYSVRDDTMSYPRSTNGQTVVRFAVAGALALAMTTQGFVLFAADDVQQIKVGAEILYVPKAWIGFGSVWAGTSSGEKIALPQPEIVEIATLGMRPRSHWGSNLGSLPTFVNIVRSPAPSALTEQSDKYKRLFDRTASLDPDSYGFVRIATGFAQPGEQPDWEEFLLKAYQNKFGEPFMVRSSNNKMVQSQTGMHIEQDMAVNYRFNNTDFPESTWWDLHKRVLAFVEYLQKPK